MGDFEIIDLFAGPGGLDVAAHSLGIPVTGIELDADACRTRRAYEKMLAEDATPMATEEGDVRDFEPEKFPSANVLAAGPPCQTFSVAGSGAGRRNLDQVKTFIRRMAEGDDVRNDLNSLSDPRTGLVLEPLRWALARREPYEAIVLEQVVTVRPVWEEVAAVLRERGYGVAVDVLNTEEYGVPQTRRRAILIARLGQEATVPAPTHQRYRKGRDGVPRKEHPEQLKPWRSMGSVLSHGRLKDFTVISNYGTAGVPHDRGQRTHNEPAFTVTSRFDRNRLFDSAGFYIDHVTPQQAALLQTFPRNYPWQGHATSVGVQIGNAIPPLLAAHILTAALGLHPGDDVRLGYGGF